MNTEGVARCVWQVILAQPHSSVVMWSFGLRSLANFCFGALFLSLQTAEDLVGDSMVPPQCRVGCGHSVSKMPHFQRGSSVSTPVFIFCSSLNHFLAVFSYCQGLGMVTAFALLIMEEEEAFWLVQAILQSRRADDYYGETLLGAMADQHVLE